METDFGTFPYRLLAVVPAFTNAYAAYEYRYLEVNRCGTRIIGRKGESLPEELEDEGRNLTLLFDQAPSFFRKLTKAVTGIEYPASLPKPTAEVSSFQFITAWLQLHTALHEAHACWEGVNESGEVRMDYFAAFQHSELTEMAKLHRMDLADWPYRKRFWFIVDAAMGDRPIACIDSEGMLYSPGGAAFNIPQMRRRLGGNLWSVISAIKDRLENDGSLF